MKKVHVYLFVDALGWEIATRHHFLEKELPERARVKMQFGYSSTSLPTILSGEPPSKHGHFSFYYFDPATSPFKIFRVMKWFGGAGLHPKCLFNRGRVRRYMSKFFAWWKGYTGYFQLYSVPFEKLPFFNYCEQSDIFARNGLAPVKNLRDILEESGVAYHMSDWRKNEAANFAAAEKVFSEGSVDFAFLYAADFDGFLHNHVGDEEAVGGPIKYYSEKVRRLFSALKAGGRPYALTVISDHGMTATKGTVDLLSVIDELGLVFGRDCAWFSDSTLLRFWYLREGVREKVHARLEQPDCKGHFLTAEEKREYGIDFPRDKFGQDIFLTDAGIQISPCDLGVKPLEGMHGYSPEHEDSDAGIFSTEPLRFQPKTVRDFFGLMKADIEEVSRG